MSLEGAIAKVESGKSTLVVRTPAPQPAQGQAPPPAQGQAPPPQPPQGSGKEMSLTVKKDATITLDGKKVNLIELRPGQKVKVTYEGTTAGSIEAKTK